MVFVCEMEFDLQLAMFSSEGLGAGAWSSHVHNCFQWALAAIPTWGSDGFLGGPMSGPMVAIPTWGSSGSLGGPLNMIYSCTFPCCLAVGASGLGLELEPRELFCCAIYIYIYIDLSIYFYIYVSCDIIVDV